MWRVPKITSRQEDALTTQTIGQWLAFIQKAMRQSTELTIILLGLPMPYLANPHMRLDRRMINMGSRKWIQKIIYAGVPDLGFAIEKNNGASYVIFTGK